MVSLWQWTLVEKTGNLSIPPYLKDAHYTASEKLGNGIGYQYAHDYPNHYVKQQYLPDAIKNERLYHFSDVAYEAKLQQYFNSIGKTDYKKGKKVMQGKYKVITLLRKYTL